MDEVLQQAKRRNLWPTTASYHAERVFVGLALLEKIMSDGSTSARQAEFDVICEGVKQNIDAMKNYTLEVDARLNAPID